jgi:hypothetical protein
MSDINVTWAARLKRPLTKAEVSAVSAAHATGDGRKDKRAQRKAIVGLRKKPARLG